MSIRSLVIAAVLIPFGWTVGAAEGGVVFGNDGLAGGYRWDAAPRMIGGNERSLDGGLRYSLQGGSYEAFRDLFHWTTLPSVENFQLAVEQAFAAWTAVDPATGLHTDLRFVADLSTPVAGTEDFDGHNPNGAEIDLFGQDAGDSGVRAITGFDGVAAWLTLTSGTTNYAAAALSGVDIKFNSNAGASYGLDTFRRLLTHEIGHALGLNDVEAAATTPLFIDDNYDGSTSETAKNTLNNSWALAVNPFDPSNSTLQLYIVPEGDPGNDSPGVNLLMESKGLGIADPGNPVTSLVPLTNDEYATRQFLYPSRVRDLVVSGDYNHDGLVDAADYTVWRDKFGQNVWWFGDGADGDRNGMIDRGDYDFWKEHFGDVVSAGPEVNPARLVPEPATLLAALTIALGTIAVPRRAKQAL